MFERLTKESRLFLSRGYLLEGQSPEERMMEISQNAENILGIEGFADKFYDYLGKGYYSLSSPVWSNFGNERGMPISCFGIELQDSVSDIMKCAGELGVMSKLGGGVGMYFGNLRPRGSEIKGNGESSGSVHFMELFDKVTDSISQGKTRRGSSSPYLNIDHGDIEEFLTIGDEKSLIQGSQTGVVIPKGWMQSMIDGDEEKREIWSLVIKSRSRKGYPYLMFQDNCENNMPQIYKDKGMRIKTSQLCNEILLNTDSNNSFVCCLSSINLLHRDEIKYTDAVETMIFFLDSVLTEFISKLENLKNSEDENDKKTFFFMEKAYNFAVRERALGLGGLGWHHYLQSNMIPFGSDKAKEINIDIWKTISERSKKASGELANLYGEPSLMQGTGLRNSTLLAIAPTKSSSTILGGVSQGIEPCFSNIFMKDLAKDKKVVKSKYLRQLLKDKGMNKEYIWDSIVGYGGSVQHLDFLSDLEKDVFKTFDEIDQNSVIEQAADRQKFICQSQSLNLMMAGQKPKYISDILIQAWKIGVKTLYYQFNESAAQKFRRNQSCEIGCKSCEA